MPDAFEAATAQLMLKRAALWTLGIVVGLVVVLAPVASLSGRQERIDIVAAAERRLGVELDSQLIATNGIRLHVVQAGPKDGPPVVLLHGYPEFWWIVATLAIVGELERLTSDIAPTPLARPKSNTFTLPSFVSITLPGFKSRCTTSFSLTHQN